MNLPASRVHLPCPASPWRNWAPCRWWVGLWLAWLVPPVLAADAASVVRFDQADYRQLQPAAPAEWQTVALPDTWGARGLPLAGRAHYRLTLPLQQAPQGVWALRIDRLSNVHSIQVNGVLVQQRGDVLSARGVPRVLSTLVEFPAALLRVGDNQIDVQWRLAARAGMSVVLAGPSDLLLPGYERARLLDQTLPQVMNVAGGALAAFLLLVWLQRRKEEAIGLFGVLWLLLSLRNYSYHVDATPLPSPWGDVLFFGGQCVSVVLLGLFVIALSGDTLPRLRRLLRGLGLVLPVLGALFGANGQLPLLRQWMYPLLSLLSLLALGLLLRSLWRRPGPALAALVAGLAAVVAAGVHDDLFLHARLPITGMYWIPLVVPLGCVSFALVLIHRLVRVLAVSEDLALRLEARVAERTLALQEADAAKTRFLAAASHDLRQPVAAIGLLVGLARDRVADVGQAGLLDRIQGAVRALEGLLRGLLDLSRLDSAAGAPLRQAVPLQALFDGLALHHQADAQARGLRLQVWDTGIGIPADQQQRVFEPFVQLHDPLPGPSPGQGLGLAIVRRAVDLLGHPLVLRSVPGRGSCFSIGLPLAGGDLGARPGPVAHP